MKEIDKPRFFREMRRLGVAHGREIDDEQLDLYWGVLSEMPLEGFLRGLTASLRSPDGYFPQPGIILARGALPGPAYDAPVEGPRICGPNPYDALSDEGLRQHVTLLRKGVHFWEEGSETRRVAEEALEEREREMDARDRWE